jgi:hypothetical protein
LKADEAVFFVASGLPNAAHFELARLELGELLGQLVADKARDSRERAIELPLRDISYARAC